MMRRLVLVVAVLLLLSGCSAVQRKEQSTAPVVGELRRPGGQTGQISSGAPQPAEPNSAPAMQPTPTTSPPPSPPSTPAPTPAEPAPSPPVESACTYPSAQTLSAKGEVLVQDGQTSIYKYAWGADCTFRQPVAAWVVQDGNVSPFLIDKKKINSVRMVILSTGEHAYLVAGEGVAAAARAYYLVVVRYGDPRLFRFPLETRTREEGVPSMEEPELTGDLLKTVERVGVGETMRYITRTYRLDPYSLTAQQIDDKTGYPVNHP